MLKLETGRVALCAGVLTAGSPAPAPPVSGDVSFSGPTEDCLRTPGVRPLYVWGVDCAESQRKHKKYKAFSNSKNVNTFKC